MFAFEAVSFSSSRRSGVTISRPASPTPMIDGLSNIPPLAYQLTEKLASDSVRRFPSVYANMR